MLKYKTTVPVTFHFYAI